MILYQPVMNLFIPWILCFTFQAYRCSGSDGSVRMQVLPVFVFVNEDWPVGRTLPDLSVCINGDAIPVSEPPELSITNGDDFAHFRTQMINETCWTLVLQRPLDADQMNGDGSRGQTFSLALRCSLGGGRQTYANLDIQIVDINDNVPRFIDTETSVSVEEGQQSSRPIFSVSTFDPDTGVGGIVSFKLVDDLSGIFELRNGSCSDSKCDADMYLLRPLDYDVRNIYTLMIQAFDGAGRIPRINKSQFKVVVNVVDVQNKGPKFTTERRIYHVNEDAQLNSNVLRIEAIDGDTGVVDPHRITYRLDGDPYYMDIHPQTGWVYVKRTLDREQPELLRQNGAITLNIIAEEDASSIPRPQSQLQISVLVDDVDDEPPRCNLSRYTAHISETAHKLIPVTLLNANDLYVFDKDTGENGEFNVSLEGPASNWFEVSPSLVFQEANLIIRVKEPQFLDFENLQNLQLRIVLTPRPYSQQAAQSCDLIINMQNANDNAPQFNQTEFSSSVKENQPAGSLVTHVTAWDADSPDFLPIIYSLLGPGAEKFAIDSSGKVITRDSLDRESVNSYHLTVQAADNGGAGHRVTAPLHINVLDTNDNKPIFSKDQWVAFIQENTLEFTQMHDGLFIKATDADEGQNGNVSYFLDESEPLSYNFTIDQASGLLEPRVPGLDRELLRHDHINLTVIAKDNGTPRQFTSKAIITVYVNDSNDNSPQFLSSFYEAHVLETAHAGEIVTQVSALDADRSSYNSRLAFRISDVQDKFVIDSQSGMITVADGANLDREGSNGQAEYRLTVLAMDMGFPQRSTQTSVVIYIDDQNDSPPVFTQELFELRVPEHAPLYTSLLNVTAIDSDTSSQLSYSIQGYSNPLNDQGRIVDVEQYNYTTLFGMRESSGELYTLQALDREQMQRVTLIVQVQDMNPAGAMPQIDECHVLIEIDDVNDNLPIFMKQSYSKTVAENSDIGTVIMSVLATDKDINRTITYSLVERTDLLSINPTTGELTVARDIDYEQVQWINVTVRATDNGSPRQSSTVGVYLSVADQNDNSPIFSPSPVYSLALPEDAPIGSQVLRVNASDRDSGSFGRVSYFLLNELGTTEPSFVINRTTGILTVNRRLDRETQAKYQLSVQAVDDYTGHINPDSHEATAIVEIEIEDVNDNAPYFPPNSPTKLALSESSAIGDVVGTVVAVDNDLNVDGHATVVYKIVGGNATLQNGKALLSIDHSKGVLRVAAEARGTYGFYAVIIQASDKGRPPLSSNTTVYLSVKDYNDHSPVIKQPTPQAVYPVNENNHTQYSPVLVISAIDSDFGENSDIRYKLKPTTTNDNWKYFSVDPISGEVFLKQALDYEKQRRFDLTAQACDNGRPPLCDEVEFAVVVRDLDDNCPFFKRSVNYTHIVSLPENDPRANSGNDIIAAVDKDTEPSNTKVCYAIIDAMPKGSPFRLAGDHSLRMHVTRPLDREKQENYLMVIRATDCYNNAVCSKGANIAVSTSQPSGYSASDTSMLLVRVNVQDRNDNPPQFAQTVFGGGVIYDTKVGSRVTKLRASDADSSDMNKLQYFLIGQAKSYIRGGKVDTGRRPFIVNSTTGDVTTNILFQPEWKGSFSLQVMVNDTAGHEDRAQVHIHLLSIDQQVELVFEKPANQLWEEADQIIRHLSFITESNATIDDVKTMETRDSTKLSKLLAHFIKPNKSIMSVEDALQALDLPKTTNQKRSKQRLISGHGLRYAGHNPDPSAETAGIRSIYLGMAGAILGLILVLFVLLMAWFVQNRRYKRKLKAATTLAFGSTDTHVPNYDVPGTNLHSGTNPVWHGVGVDNYGMEYEPHGDACSRNSLDENELQQQIHNQNGHVKHKNGLHSGLKCDGVPHFFSGETDRSLPRSNGYSLGGAHQVAADDVLRTRFKNPAPMMPPGHRSSLPRTNGTLNSRVGVHHTNGVSHVPNGGDSDRTMSPQPVYPNPIMASLESTEL